MTNQQNRLSEAMDALVHELAKLPPDERAATAAQIARLMEDAALGLLERHPEILGGDHAGDR